MRNRTYRMAAAGLLAAAMLISGCGDAAVITKSEIEGTTESVSDGEGGAAASADSSGNTAAQSDDSTVQADTSATDVGDGNTAEDAEEDGTTASFAASGSAELVIVDAADAPAVGDLTCTGMMQLDYAECFDVYYYEDGYKLIEIPESGSYLVVPDGASVPEDLSDDITVIEGIPDSIYIAASSTMSLFAALDALDNVTLSGLDEDGWYIDAPKEALASGAMTYAGKYSEPDYETLIAKDCDLAIESTMILHAPEVQEMLEDLDIPVFIDRSSYESQALGRTEWIKAYAALLDKEDEAFAFFAEQEQVINELAGFENTGKTVAFFTVTSTGTITVRSSNDYIPNMIETAGGVYIFDDLASETSSASVSISMEEFYSTAVNADYLIYNATIEDALTSVDDLIAKDELFADFKAVQEGNVWQVDKAMYQSTDRVGQLIRDFYIMFTDGDTSQLTFLSHVE